MRKLLIAFVLMIAAGGAAGASASDPRYAHLPPVYGNVPYGTGSIHPPSLPADVTCTAASSGGVICFYPAHER